MKQFILLIPSILVGLLLSSCAIQSGAERSAAIKAQVLQQGWSDEIIHTPLFDLQSFTNQQPVANELLTIYLEGDGHAWVHGQFPSEDPTPYTPVGLQLAMAQPGGAVAYLGRPCQYIGSGSNLACASKVWTEARFSEAVVLATNEALNQLKMQAKAQRLQLIGYSGGAAIALLLAARRNDIVHIITVAGNLDPHTWVQTLHLQTLTGSLDPVAVIAKTVKIPQIDFIGGKDEVIPPEMSAPFAVRYPVDQQPRIIVVPENGHVCCWVEQWPTLWQSYLK